MEVNVYDEKPFKRAGLQEDGSIIQEISRMRDGERGRSYYPPEEGMKVASTKGPFKVEKVSEVMEVRGEGGRRSRWYYRATGNLVGDE